MINALQKFVFKDYPLYPIMGERHGPEAYGQVNLSRQHLSGVGVHDEDGLKAYLAATHQASGVRYLWGGYLERRSLYQSDLFKDDPHAIRDIHLGIDIWGIVYDVVHAPLDGIIHSYAYNDHDLDYGYTLILAHTIDDQTFYTLYGHLGDTYYHQWKIGQQIKAGHVIADIGPKETNGGWLPHLHFQCMLDMQDKKGDYPGVCSSRDKEKYQTNCPDPICLIAPIKKRLPHDEEDASLLAVREGFEPSRGT